jgi:GMP synthase-like glutamine amidotransferase
MHLVLNSSDGARAPRALVVQHVETEPPGPYLDVLLESGWEVDCRMHRPGLRPLEESALTQMDALLVMGGPLTVAEPSAWREHEMALIDTAIRRGMPCLGVCLGAQLLAAVLGATVRHGDGPEIGLLDLELTPEGEIDPLSRAMGPAPTVLQWHSDTFELPEGAIRLASSAAYPNQFFRYGNAWGLQFHVETTAALARRWLKHPSYCLSANEVFGKSGIDGFIDQVEAAERSLHEIGRRIAHAWSTGILGEMTS